jgi:prophage regulatory protein
MPIEPTTRFLRLPEVSRRVAISRSSIYALVATGSFPASHRLAARAVGWVESDIDEWMQARIATAPSVPAAPLPTARTRDERVECAAAPKGSRVKGGGR